jgi:hypothetical protein
MAIDASGVLGSRQLAGVKVSPLGTASRQITVRRGVGAGIMVTDQPRPGPSDTPPFGRVAYLAVTDQELALIRLRSRNGFTMEAVEVIAQVPRSQWQAAEIGPGLVAPVTVTFTDGSIWEMEVPLLGRRHAREVVGALGGRRLAKSDLPPRPVPQMSRFRILCGIFWAAFAVILVAGGVGELTISNVAGAVVCFLLAVPSAWYDYRIWALKARRLLLIF